ncbi:MAG: hypothetical protein ACP5QT_01705 [Brevinematia bacterium]
MKIFRIVSVILLTFITAFLVLGNVFHKNIRRYVDGSYVELELNNEMMNGFEKLKKGNADFLLYVYTDKKVYRNLEKITIVARIERKSPRELVEGAKLKVSLYDKAGNIIRNIDGSDSVLLVYDKKNKLWKGNFFPINTGLAGEIKIEVTAYIDTPEASVSTIYSVFVERSNSLYVLPKGLSFMGINSIERISKRIILSLYGKEVDWTYIPEWLNTISADGVLMNVGLTTSFQEEITMTSPWNREKLAESDALAERLSQRGMSFAGYIKALKIEGAYVDKIGYNPSFNLTADGFSEGGCVSLLDENRKNSLMKLFVSLIQNKNYTYVGLSDLYLYNGEGIELCEVFFRDIQFASSEWEDLDFTNKIKFFSEKLRNKELLEVFERWKKYYIAGYIREIVEASGHTKPVFYYVDYENLKKDSSLIDVLLNSGVDFVVVNFNIPYFDLLKEINALRNDYLSLYADKLIFSYEIDYKKNLESSSLKQGGIEVYFNLYVTAIKEMSRKFNVKGIMINDLYNVMSGKRGPYSPLEWMFGVGKIIYNFKSINSKMALDIDYYFPINIEYEKEFGVYFKMKNLSDRVVRNLKVDFIDDDGNVISKENLSGELKTGDFQEKNFNLLIKERDKSMMKDSHLIGIKLSWEEKTEKENPISRNFLFFENFKIASVTN